MTIVHLSPLSRCHRPTPAVRHARATASVGGEVAGARARVEITSACGNTPILGVLGLLATLVSEVHLGHALLQSLRLQKDEAGG